MVNVFFTMTARVLVGVVHLTVPFQVLREHEFFVTKVTLGKPLSLSGPLGAQADDGLSARTAFTQTLHVEDSASIHPHPVGAVVIQLHVHLLDELLSTNFAPVLHLTSSSSQEWVFTCL